MKYKEKNTPIKCYMTQSKWYRNTGKVSVKGVLIHSTGANNPTIKRYVQPDDNAKNRNELLNLIGINKNKNDWNHISIDAGVNAFIGKLANGEVSTVQVGPWDKKPWGCYKGKNGSCNNGWIQFEICEDDLKNKNYFDKIYNETVELIAYLCKLYNLNPKGTVIFNGVTVPVILCHKDSYNLGLGSNHGDVLHWFPKFGKTMENVRNDVYNLLKSESEDEDMTLDQFTELYKQMRVNLQDNDASSWSEDARKWAVETGLVQGSSNDDFNGMWEDVLTREQMVTILYRFFNMLKNE